MENKNIEHNKSSNARKNEASSESFENQNINHMDEKYMDRAMNLALEAYKLTEVPIGALIVYEGKIIGEGYNRRNTDKSTFAHAEMIAMEQAMDVIGDWRLEETVMYVTLEPCPMCAGAIVQARIPKVVIGTMNPKAGCAGSVMNLLDEPGFNHQVETIIGVRGKECKDMMQLFFKELRYKKRQKKTKD